MQQVSALGPFFPWPVGDSPRALFYPRTPGPLADSWLNAGSIIRLQRDGTLPLRFRRESFEFRLPIKLKCNFPSTPLSSLTKAVRVSLPRHFFLAITLYLFRTKSQTFGAITSETSRYYDAYCFFIARNGAGGVVLATRWGQSVTVPYQIKRSLFCCRTITKKRSGREKPEKLGQSHCYLFLHMASLVNLEWIFLCRKLLGSYFLRYFKDFLKISKYKIKFILILLLQTYNTLLFK